ncbi:MAG: NAD(P)/FAD-dependent oxidoreductase [Chloroflexi bacterium]|nr:NAD(P)/FAD-dependent oxidoreductase [Chloroflexota bacterium]
MHDVAVIGAGPVGSRVAGLLALKGHRVVVIDRKGSLGEPVCCTGIIGRECVDLLGLDNEVVHRWTNAARLFSPHGKLIELHRPEPQVAIVDRATLNVWLACRAQEHGAEYRLDSRVAGIRIENDYVRLQLDTTQDGNPLLARVVVIASGSASRLPESVGLGRPADVITGAQAEVETTGVTEVEVYLGSQAAPGFFGWLVPTSPGRGLVGILCRHSAADHMEKLIGHLQAQGKIASRKVEPGYGRIALQPLERTCGERVLVVGGAAGQIKPTTGGGIYYGLLCADIAAGHVDRALKSNDLSSKSLSSYHREWQRKLGAELRTGYWARKIYERLSDQQIDQLFDIVKSSGLDKAMLQMKELSFDWHGAAILRFAADRAISRAIESMKIPFLRRGVKAGANNADGRGQVEYD